MIEYNIYSENSQHHWGPINVKDRNVLDLGCGRSWTKELNHSSSIYFGECGAKSVVSVDASKSEIDYFNSVNPDKNKYTFLCMRIDGIDDIRYLLSKYKFDAIKCDIEGFETAFYNITKLEMEDVKEFALEYHSSEILNNMTLKLIEWGFTIHTKAKFTYNEDFKYLGSVNVDPSNMGVIFSSKI